MRERRHFFLIPLAAVIAILPLILHGCSCGHDFNFHLLSWMEVSTQLAHGNLHPHWAFTPAWDAGEPRFVFYPPISWYLGSALGLILTHLPGVSEAQAWTAAPIIFTWISLTLSGLTLYRLARGFASSNAALIAATLYLANPYMLFTAYERTAYAELLAAAWIPLLLDSILRERVTIPRIALPLTLLWLTNAPAAVIGTYTLAVLAVLRLVRTAGPHADLAPEPWVRRYRTQLDDALTTVAGTVVGLALAAFYILPAAHERRFVQIAMATIEGMNVPENFLFKHTGVTADEIAHDVVLHTASLIAVALIVAVAVALAAAFWRDSKRWDGDDRPFPAATLAILIALVAFLLTPLSASVWSHAPQLTFLQFPWRWLIVVAPVFAVATARAITDLPLIAARLAWMGRASVALQAAFVVPLGFALTLPAYNLYKQRCFIEDAAPTRLALFHSNLGTDPTDEYTPVGADNDSLALANPPYWLGDSPGASAPSAQPGRVPAHLTVNAARPEVMILNLRDYPDWHVTLNETPSPAHLHRDDGLIAFAIPAGRSTVDVRYATSSDQTAGDAITLMALVPLVVGLRRKRKN